MIPVATLTNLDNEYSKDSMLARKLRNLVTRMKSAGECAEFSRVDVRQFNQFHLVTNRAIDSS